ncbi:hypothetical protein M0R72_14655 [Candidatus Pacearchaeota archaeon]|jgi:hypothetical protein|nr:hypothetical protein [Candidatus Pacearchaeota archaeon]
MSNDPKSRGLQSHPVVVVKKLLHEPVQQGSRFDVDDGKDSIIQLQRKYKAERKGKR